MRLKLNEGSKKFDEFLKLFNLLKNEGGQELQFSQQLIDLRFKLENTNWDQDDESWEQIDSYRDLIDKETKKLFANNSQLCIFLFGTDSIHRVTPEPVEGQKVLDRNTLGKIICEAIASLQNFISNCQTLSSLMFYIERNRYVAELQQQIGIDKLFSTSWTGIGMVSYLLSEKGQLKINLNQNDFFYGYRDFARIFRCIWCEKYFLAKRKDSKFCSDKCRNSYKHKKWLDVPNNREKHLGSKREHYLKKLKQKNNSDEK